MADFGSGGIDGGAGDSMKSRAKHQGAVVPLSNKSHLEAPPPQDGATSPRPAAVVPRDVSPEDDDKLFDAEKVWAAAGYVREAVQRHKRVAIGTFVIVFGAIATLAQIWPKTYEAGGRLLMQRNDITVSLVNPARTIPREAESPTLAAQEVVLARENVVAVMEKTNLLAVWDRTRSPLLRLKDLLVRLVRPDRTVDERIDSLAGLVEQRLAIETTPEGAVNFFIRWPDPQMAYRLVDEMMKSFLEYRRATETAAINESIAILDKSVASLEEQITRTAAQVPRRRQARAVSPAPARAAGLSPASAVQLSRLKAQLDGAQQEIARIAALRAQQLAEAQVRLATARTIYTASHPTVLAARQTVEQLSRDSPELVAARRQAGELEAQYDALSVKLGADAQTAQPFAAPATPSFISLPGLGDELDPAFLRLQAEIAELSTIRERASAARAELASAEAGFKYRYTVTRPARVPRWPVGPNVPAIMLAGLIAGVIFAVLAPVGLRMIGR
jgi:uncharacterized protein involved in exopolysaccharide biosynthesis